MILSKIEQSNCINFASMAKIIKRGDSYFVQVRMIGVSKSKSFKSMMEARAWKAETETAIRNGTFHNPTGFTFIEALKKYGDEVSAGKRGERWELIRMRSWVNLPFANYRLSEINTRILAEWRDLRLTKVKSSTVNRELNLMSSIFEQARREWQWITTNPVRDVRRPPQPAHRTRCYTDIERDAICAALGFDGKNVETKQHIVAVAFLFALETAMRRDEILSLTWDRVYVDRKHVKLLRTKNGDSRDVPLSKRAIELLGLMQGYDKPFCVGNDVLSTLFRKAVIKSGIPQGTFHDARGTAVTRLSKLLNILDLALMIGHRDIKSLQIYYREAVESLADKLF